MSEPIVEHGTEQTDDSMIVWNESAELEGVYPLAQRIPDHQRHGEVYRRRVIVVSDWERVPK